MPNTIKESDLLNTAFNDTKVLSADISTLKRYLMACVEMRESDITNARVRDGLPKRTEFIRELISLEIKTRELRIARASMYMAAFFAAGAFLVSVNQEFREVRREYVSKAVKTEVQAPDSATVHEIVAKAVKLSLELHLGPVDVSVGKYVLGEPVAEKHVFGITTHFPCKAMYSTIDSRGNTDNDGVWIGNLTRNELGKWIAIPFRVSASTP